MKINIKEMAKKAGVSVATISRAMNSETRSKVATKTLKKIDGLVQKYGYTPNLAAKNLRQTSTKTIGVVFPYLPGIFYSPYYIHILSGISDSLFDTQYQFKLLLLKDKKENWDQYDFKQGERVDGLIITHWFKFFSDKNMLEKVNVPCVIINDLEKNVKAQFVCGDHYKGGALAGEHFYQMGHRQIAVLTGPDWSKDSEQRFEGFKDYLAKNRVHLDPDLILNADYQQTVAYQKVDQLLKMKKGITGIFCCNDHMAFGVLQRLHELNIVCPDEISVMGYDDDDRSREANPPLTTIRVPIYDLAKESSSILIQYLEDSEEQKFLSGQKIFPVEIIKRESVKNLKK